MYLKIDWKVLLMQLNSNKLFMYYFVNFGSFLFMKEIY